MQRCANFALRINKIKLQTQPREDVKVQMQVEVREGLSQWLERSANMKCYI